MTVPKANTHTLVKNGGKLELLHECNSGGVLILLMCGYLSE